MSLKLSNANSQFGIQKQEENNFEQKIKEKEKNVNQDTEEAKILGIQMIKILADKTLKENKGQIAKNLEQKTIEDLQKLATKTNLDSEFGEGSIMLFTIAISACMKFRDRTNELEFKLQEMQNKLDNLSE